MGGGEFTEGSWIFQDSEYARFLRLQTLHEVLNMRNIAE